MKELFSKYENIIKNALRKNSFSISSVIFERIIILYHKRKLILQLVPISSVDEKGIKFKHAYTGNLTRQEVTAQHVLKYSNNKGTKITTTTKLREGGYGSFEGDSIAADNQKIANVYGYQDGKEFQQATGKDYWNKLQNAYYKLDSENSQNTNLAKSDRTESAKQVQKRMSSELLHIAKTMQKQGGDNVLVVSSGMSINEYLSTMTNKYEGKPMQNAAVIKLVYKNGKFKVQGPIGTLHYVNKGQKIAADK